MSDSWTWRSISGEPRDAEKAMATVLAASSLGKFSLRKAVKEELKCRTELGRCHLWRVGPIEAGRILSSSRATYGPHGDWLEIPNP